MNLEPLNRYEYLNKAISLDSNYAFAYINRRVAWKNKGNYDLAISDFSKAIESNSAYVEAYYNHAYCYKKLGRNSKAAGDYNN